MVRRSRNYNPSNTTLNAVYTPTAAEISAGHVTLTLTSTGNGSCLAVSAQMIITIGRLLLLMQELTRQYALIILTLLLMVLLQVQPVVRGQVV